MSGAPLVLKVMRLRRPLTEPAPPVLSAGGFFEQSPCSDAPKLLLPMSLTQSLVGEPFSGYLHLANVGASPVANVALRAEMQVDSVRVVLFDSGSHPLVSLAPGDFFDVGVEHELQDAGTFVLMCNVSYTVGTGAAARRETLKRNYRFPAPQPFGVNQRVVQVGSQLLAECSVQNATSSDLYLTSVHFECADGLEVADKAALLPAPRLLRPRDAESVVFTVRPMSAPVSPAGCGVTVREEDACRAMHRLREQDVVGHLRLGWEAIDGACGCVEGHQIRLQPLGVKGIELRVASGPRRVGVEEPFTLEAEVTNCTGQVVEPCIVIEQRLLGAIRVRGATRRHAGRLEPSGGARVDLELVATTPGLHPLRGLLVVDELSQMKVEFGPLCEIVAF